MKFTLCDKYGSPLKRGAPQVNGTGFARSDCGAYEVTFSPLGAGEWCNAWVYDRGVRKYLGSTADRDEAKKFCERHQSAQQRSLLTTTT